MNKIIIIIHVILDLLQTTCTGNIKSVNDYRCICNFEFLVIDTTFNDRQDWRAPNILIKLPVSIIIMSIVFIRMLAELGRLKQKRQEQEKKKKLQQISEVLSTFESFKPQLDSIKMSSSKKNKKVMKHVEYFVARC